MIGSNAIAAWTTGLSEENAEHVEWQRRRSSDPRLRPAMRACLGPICLGRRRFWSEHAGHRICPTCRATIALRYGIVFAGGSDAA